MTTDMVLASTCPPTLFHAIEINGEPCWDGGYIANPTHFPMLEATGVLDTLIVQINPLRIEEVPGSARGIMSRLGEIIFNSSLIKEVRMINQKSELVAAGELDVEKHPPFHLHMIHGGSELQRFDNSSKLLTEWQFLNELHEICWQNADIWLKANQDKLGQRSTLDAAALIAGTLE
jgi:NTE family protein